ncbi:hypothetical protein BJP41_06205 [Candidatus Williamhamiltonella defendens]|uniref:Uncharacterized protein n=1 Tax=Candidatus Williamhamiltonella defendens TaxID=138072 RepID=A0A2D3T2E2_9ENTR|nr:hypothetical protein [Candidatus Hamiltonella defensa]ATW29989.1 hypothetical protein BJP41_06205 [Candidatus Hamiltonella defensa]ATW31963.1 hypothetical protein BJP42_06300 [Candidatus Hamiltonella defensa]
MRRFSSYPFGTSGQAISPALGARGFPGEAGYSTEASSSGASNNVVERHITGPVFVGGGDDPGGIKRRDGAQVVGVASFDGRTKCRGLIKSPSGGHPGSPLPLSHIPQLARDVPDGIPLCAQYRSARIDLSSCICTPNKLSP